MEAGDNRERTVRWEDPLIAADLMRELSGIESLRAVLRGDVPAPPIAQLMGFALTEVEEGRGSVHGGFALTLFDSALGCAIHSTLPAGVAYATTDVHVRFIRGLTKETGLVRCDAQVVHVGRTTAVAEARLRDRDGNLLGVGTTACAIFRASAPRA